MKQRIISYTKIAAFLSSLLGFIVISPKQVQAQWSIVGNYPTEGIFKSYINSLTTDNSGNLYANRGAMNDSGKYYEYVAKWNGSSWSELGGTNNSHFNWSIECLTTDAKGNLYAGGLASARDFGCLCTRAACSGLEYEEIL